MSAALGTIGILAILIAGVMLVVSVIRKKRLRIWGIIAGVGLVLFITGMALTGPTTPPPTPVAETPAPVVQLEPVQEPELALALVHDLVIYPTEVKPDQEIDITATVTNDDDFEGDYLVVFKIDNEVIKTERVTLEGFVHQRVKLLLKIDYGVGTHTVDVNGFSGTFTVEGEVAPALTTAEQAYANAVADQAMSVGKALTQFGELLQNPQYGDDAWTLQVATQLVIIQTVYDQAMELDPPSSMAEIHLKYTQGMKAYNDMTYLFARGVDELDLNLIDQAVTKMETGIRLINEATELMREFTEAHK